MTDSLVYPTPTGRLILPADEPRNEWLKARRSGIGGSDALAVLGLSPHGSRWAVWADKSGLLPEQDDREAMVWGRRLEPLIADEFHARTGIGTVTCGLMQHVDRTWQLASVDRLTTDGGVLEIKTTSERRADDWEDDQLADAAEAQLQHYLAVTGLDHGYAAALIGGQRLEIRHAERDDRLIRVLLEAEEELWQMVLDGTPPALDGSAATAKAIAAIWPNADRHAVELPAEAADILAESLHVHEEIKTLENRRTQIKNFVTGAMGTADIAVHDGRRLATWKNTGQFDQAAFTAAHPELAEKFTRLVPQLDRAALKEAHPDLYADHRSRRFCITPKETKPHGS